jgi:hypothetical protein
MGVRDELVVMSADLTQYSIIWSDVIFRTSCLFLIGWIYQEMSKTMRIMIQYGNFKKR